MIPVAAYIEDLEVIVDGYSYGCEVSVSATYVFHAGDYHTPSEESYENLTYTIIKVLDEEGEEVGVEGMEDYIDEDILEELLDEQNDIR